MTFIVTRNPQNFIKSLNDELSSMFEDQFENYFPFDNSWNNMSNRGSIPIEFEDKGTYFELNAQLPGIRKEDIDLDIDSKHITIKAKSEKEKVEKDGNKKKSEFHYGSFSRTISFPEEIDLEKVEAKLQDGILKLEIQKKEQEKEQKRKIEIQ